MNLRLIYALVSLLSSTFNVRTPPWCILGAPGKHAYTQPAEQGKACVTSAPHLITQQSPHTCTCTQGLLVYCTYTCMQALLDHCFQYLIAFGCWQDLNSLTVVSVLPCSLGRKEGGKYHIYSSRLGLIQSRHILIKPEHRALKAILDRVCYTNEILLPHELLQGTSAIHKKCSLLIPHTLRGTALKDHGVRPHQHVGHTVDTCAGP